MSNIILYLKPFLLALFFSLIFTKTLILFGERYGLYDKIKKNKIHKKNIARFGGVAIIISFLLAIFLNGELVFDNLKWGVVVSTLVILFFGLYDDIKNISWKKQLGGQVFVVFIMIYTGLQVDYIANPFGGSEFRLDFLQYSVFGVEYSLFGSLFILFWIIGLMNIMNWLDGLDGLAGGVGFIGVMTLFFLSISSIVNQPPLGIILIAVAGAILGFLFFNFNPAKIFMGTSGSIFLGFILAVLAIFSGGKIATLLLVMGFPILDAVLVIIQRIKAGKSIFKGDTYHLHYRLLKNGWSQRKIILFIYFVCLSFSIVTIIFQDVNKVIILFILFLSFSFFLKSVLRDRVLK